MGLSTKDIHNLLKEITEYGVTFYYLLERKKMSLEDLGNCLFKDSIEQINLLFPKLISKISEKDIEDSHEIYEKEYTRLDCVDRIIARDKGRHQHLREIRNIVNLETEVKMMVKEDVYQASLNLHYTRLIIEKLENSNKKSFLSKLELLKLYQASLDLLTKENDNNISDNIDSYYIKTLTS